MKTKTTNRSWIAAMAVAAGLLATACGGGGGGGGGSSVTPTAGADPSYASSDSKFDYASAKTVVFADVLAKMKTSATLPAGISATKGYVTIYVGTSDDRTQLAFLTVDLYQALIGGTVSSESMGVEIPLGTTQVYYEIYGEDGSGSAVTPVTGSVTI